MNSGIKDNSTTFCLKMFIGCVPGVVANNNLDELLFYFFFSVFVFDSFNKAQTEGLRSLGLRGHNWVHFVHRL